MFTELINKWIAPEIGFLAFACWAWGVRQPQMLDTSVFLVIAGAVLGIKELGGPIKQAFIRGCKNG